MNYYGELKIKWNSIKLLLFTIATSFVSYGQETNDSDALDSLLDELFFSDKEFVDDLLNSINQYDLLYTSISLNSNTFFAGRDSGTDQINMIPQVSYYSSSGFNATISSIYFSKQNPNWDFVGTTLGYANTIGVKKNVHYNVSYSRFFYSDGWSAFNNSLDALLGIRNSKRTFGGILSGSYLFGTDQSVQISARVYGNFALSRGLNYALKFRPQINFLVARQASTFILPTRPGQPPRIVTIEEFGLLNSQLSIPISLTTSSWDIEFGWNINLPRPIQSEGTLNSTNFFSLSVGYLFDLRK